MEKTIQIFIASTSFLCTEEAFSALSSYLERLKAHFETEPDRDEIIGDIELRIAEKLLEQNHPLIQIADVSTVIAEVGDISQIDDAAEEPSREARAEKRLYRDTDTAVIAGVAGGIAAYFGVSPIFMRLLFLVSLFFGGTGFFIYIMLWIVIPEAKTSAQKLQMHGKPVTFESIGTTVKTRIAESEQNGAFRRVSSFSYSIVSKTLSFGAKALGIFIAFGSFVGLITLTVFLGIVLTNWNAPYNDIPLREASSTLLLGSALISGYIAASIPLLFIFALGFRLVRNRTIMPAVLGFALIGVWSLALVALGVSGVRIGGDYYMYRETSPEYATVVETRNIDPFDRIVIDDAQVQVQQGDAYEVTLEGRTKDIERIMLSSADNILTVATTEAPNDCFFCTHSTPTVTVTVPGIASLEAKDSTVSFSDYTDDVLEIATENSSIRGSLNINELTASVKNTNFRSDFAVQNLTLNATDSSFTLGGNVENASITLQDTSLYADALVIQNATLNTSDSYAELDVRGTFEQNADDESNIILEERNNTEQPILP